MEKWKITKEMLAQLKDNKKRNAKIQAIKDLRNAIANRGEFADLAETKRIVDSWWDDTTSRKYFKVIKDKPEQPHPLQVSKISISPIDNAFETIARLEAAIKADDERFAKADATIRALEAKIERLEVDEQTCKQVYTAMEELRVSHIEGLRGNEAFNISLEPSSPLPSVLQLIHPVIRFYYRKS